MNSVLECLHCPASMANGNWRLSTIGQGFVCEIPKLPLLPGNYRLNYEISLDGVCVDAQVSARNVEVVAGKILRNLCAAGSIEHSDLRGLQVADGLSAEGLVFVLERS